MSVDGLRSQLERRGRLVRRRPVALLIAVCGLPFVATPTPAAGGAATHTVVIEAMAFHPQRLTVRRGDTVVWINKDPFPHTATAAGVFDSRSIPAGGSWKQSMRKPGKSAYLCTLHSNMQAVLEVE